MKKYQLPLTRNYVMSWTPIEAVREILQNAIDYGHGKLDVKIGTDSIRVYSEGARLLPKTLLLGSSSKANDDDVIGSFGEGYKIALLVLAREGIQIEIRNNEVIWKPDFEFCEDFQEEVLVINEEQAVGQHLFGVEFIIQGLSFDHIEKIKENTLQLQNNIGRFHRVQEGDILLDRAGKLYVNGLFVTDTELEFGYNMKPQHLKLERDRQTVSTFDIQFMAKDMWFGTGLTTEIAEMMERGCPDLEYAHYGCPELVKEACYKMFVTKHPTAVIASSRSEMEAIVKRGVTNEIVIYASSYASTVSSHDLYKLNVTTKEVLKPAAELKLFLQSNKKHMRRAAIDATKDLIKKSESWKL